MKDEFVYLFEIFKITNEHDKEGYRLKKFLTIHTSL